MTETQSIFYRERSYQACVATAWRLLINEYKSVLKYSWLQAVTAGAGVALLSFLLFVHYLWFTPAALAWVAVVLLVYGLAAACWQSSAYVQVDFYRASGELPHCGSHRFAGNLRHRLGRSLLSLLLFVVALALIGGSLYASLCLSPWWWIAVAAVLGGVVVGGLWVQIVLVERAPLRESWKLLRSEGLKSLGSWFLVQLTGWLTVGVISLVFFLPTIVLSASYFVSHIGVINGDASGMPGYAAWLYFFAAWLAGTGMHLSTLLAIWPRSLMVASMVSKAKNRERQNEELLKLRQEQVALQR